LWIGTGRSGRVRNDMSLVLYRECDGAVVLKSKVLLIAGAFPIQLLAGSRLAEAMGIGLSRA
jgi:hypothetical protein